MNFSTESAAPAPTQTEVKDHCLLCSSKGTVLYGDLRDRLYGVPGRWSLFKCSNPSCGLVWQNPMTLEQDIHRAYSRYFTHGSTPGPARTPGLHWRVLNSVLNVALACTRRQRDRREAQALYLGPLKPGTVLEIGCGAGHNLARMQGRGWKALGHEVDIKAAAHAREVHGLEVHTGPLESLERPPHGFDVIYMNHVLEHLHRPRDVLKACLSLLADTGRMVIVTPNVESHGHHRYRKDWLHLDPPRHVFLWSIRSLAKLLEQERFTIERNSTSHANDDVLIMHSLSLRQNGFTDISAPVSPGLKAAARLAELRAALARFWTGRHDEAEECVVVAGRSPV